MWAPPGVGLPPGIWLGAQSATRASEGTARKESPVSASAKREYWIDRMVAAANLDRLDRLGQQARREKNRVKRAARRRAARQRVQQQQKKLLLQQLDELQQPKQTPQTSRAVLHVGDAVEAFMGATGPYSAVVDEVHDGGAEYTLDWTDGDPNGRRQSAINITARTKEEHRPQTLNRLPARREAARLLAAGPPQRYRVICRQDPHDSSYVPTAAPATPAVLPAPPAPAVNTIGSERRYDSFQHTLDGVRGENDVMIEEEDALRAVELRSSENFTRVEMKAYLAQMEHENKVMLASQNLLCMKRKLLGAQPRMECAVPLHPICNNGGTSPFRNDKFFYPFTYLFQH